VGLYHTQAVFGLNYSSPKLGKKNWNRFHILTIYLRKRLSSPPKKQCAGIFIEGPDSSKTGLGKNFPTQNRR
jgi:hypothetical protein